MGGHCEVCGETRFEHWSYCPACDHPYPDADEADDEDEWDDEDDEDADRDDDDD